MAEITKVALKVDNNNSFPNNNAGAITPAILRAFNVNMIDSMVDEIGYTADSASWNVSISNINAFTASAQSLTTASLLITASAQPNSNVITFTKGNGSTFNVTVATGSIPDISNLNQATASLQSFTASAQISINNLNTTTASLNTSVSNINTFTASTAISITNLNASSASQQVSIDSINSKTGSYATTGSNTFVSANTFTSISASSFVSASQFVGDGSKITGITSSISLPILDEGIPVGNAVSMNFTGSAISAIVVGGTAVISVDAISTSSFNSLTASFNAYTASTNSDLNAIHQATASLQTNSASVNISITNLNASSASQQVSIDALNTNSASVNTSISALNTYTASQSTASLVTSITNLNTFSASALVSISNINSTTASLLVETQNLELFSASALISISNLNASSASQQISIDNLNTNSASVNTSITNINSATASLFTSASLALVTASFDNGTRNLTFTKGDTQTFSVNIPDVSGSAGTFVTTSSFNAYTSSNDQKVNSLINATGSYATTGSNSFDGNQIITGSVTISGSATSDLTVVGQIFVSSSATGGTAAPKITVSGSAGSSTINRNNIQTRNTTDNGGIFPSTLFTQDLATLDEIGFTVDTSVFSITGWSTGPAFYINNTALDTYPAVFGFQNKANYTDGRVAVLTPLSASAGFTASLQNGYAWVGNSLGQNTQVATSSFGTAINTGSFATLGANTFTGSQTISSSLNVSGSANFVGGDVNFTDQGRNINIDVDRTIIKGQKPTLISSSLDIQGSLTASLANGYAWVGDATNHNVLVATSSFGTPIPTGTISGSAQITALGFVSSSVTASSLVTASVNLNTITFTKGDGTTFPLTVNTGSGGAAFPFTGSAQITGSLGVTGSVSGFVNTLTISSNTASMNFNDGNFFTLQLVSGSITHLTGTNIRPGQTINLLVKTDSGSAAATGSLTFSPTFKFAGGFDYTPTAITASQDLVSFVTFDTTQILAAQVKNLS